MDCERAKEFIVELLYDEIASESASELQDHLAECEDCLKYRTELQQTTEYLNQVSELQAPIDLTALHDAIDRKQHRIRHYFRRRWPVWATVGACFVMLLLFALFVSEIRYENNALTITFNGEEKESLAEKTDRMMATYRKDQLVFQKQITDELRASTAVLLNVIGEYESRRNRQIAEAFQQIILDTREELGNLASKTENRINRNYLMTMTTMAGMVDSP